MNYEMAQHVADVLKAVAHPVRLQIIELLENGEQCVGDIVKKLDVPQAVVSQQLGLMKDKQVLQSRRQGTSVFYTIKNENVIKLLHCLCHHCDNDSTQNSE